MGKERSESSFDELLTQCFNEFKALPSESFAAHCGFWSNRRVFKDGTEYSVNRELVRVHRDDSNNAGTPVKILEDFETENHLMMLDNIGTEMPNLTPIEMGQVFAVRSYAYTKALGSERNLAKDSVVMAVDGAIATSIFREIELIELMNNRNVKNFHLLDSMQSDASSIELTPVKVLDKREAYHELRDKWLDSRMSAYLEAKNNNSPDLNVHRKLLANEIIEAERNLKEEYPFSLGNKAVCRDDTKYLEADRMRERDRLSKVSELMGKDYDLEIAVGVASLRGKRTVNQETITKLKKQDSIDRKAKMIIDALEQGSVLQSNVRNCNVGGIRKNKGMFY